MKLYTEEVLRNSMNSVKYYMEHYDASVIDSIIDKHIKALGYVELPNDEEIEDETTLSGYGLKEYLAEEEAYTKFITELTKEQDNGK